MPGKSTLLLLRPMTRQQDSRTAVLRTAPVGDPNGPPRTDFELHSGDRSVAYGIGMSRRLPGRNQVLVSSSSEATDALGTHPPSGVVPVSFGPLRPADSSERKRPTAAVTRAEPLVRTCSESDHREPHALLPPPIVLPIPGNDRPKQRRPGDWIVIR